MGDSRMQISGEAVRRAMLDIYRPNTGPSHTEEERGMVRQAYQVMTTEQIVDSEKRNQEIQEERFREYVSNFKKKRGLENSN